jgi:hypothetical protein
LAREWLWHNNRPQLLCAVLEIREGAMRRGVVTLCLLAAGVPAFSQAPKKWTPGVTADGQPDLTGLWIDNSATPLERPNALEGRQTLTDAEVAEMKQRAERLFHSGNGSDFAVGDNVFLAALANPPQYRNPNISTSSADEMIARVFDNRTSLIVDPPDGRIPALTAAAVQRQASRPPAVAAGTRPPARVQDLNSAIRCITPGVPRIGGRYGAGELGYYEIFQAPGYFVYFSEVMHEARIIPLDGSPHLPADVRGWLGDSRGHWEGKTLVVDTTNFSEKTNFMGSAENLHLVERFTRVAENEIRYEVTMDDPTTWTRPWTVMVRLYASKEPMYEYACHEGNQFVTAGILSGPR